MFILVGKEVYQNSIGSFELRFREVHSNTCPSSAGDLHEQFGRHLGASLQSLLSKRLREPNLQILDLQEHFLNPQEPSGDLQEHFLNPQNQVAHKRR